MKGPIIAIIIAVAVALGFFSTRHNSSSQPTPNTETPSGEDTSSTPPVTNNDLIRNVSVTANSLVKSPLAVTGEARGPWYFEASFPVRLEDANGTVLIQTHADAQGEWMTTEFVPFKVTLTFTAPATTTGVLVLEKDNPSGLPEHAAEVRIPVRFR